MPNRALPKDETFEALPYLHRYARALTGSQETGDAYVRATLAAAPGGTQRCPSIGGKRIELYQAFSEIWNSAREDACAAAGRDALAPRLARISSIQRQALLLTELEEFSLAQAAQILGLAISDTAALVRQAIIELEQDVATDILVIEDEPLISSHIEAIVEDMGHRVVAVAATPAQAGAACAAHRPGLLLADIRLAEDNSGLTAVDDVLALAPIPVVFITACPERLLTGERPEPSFLVAKPLREESLRATIGQALFLGAARDARARCHQS